MAITPSALATYASFAAVPKFTRKITFTPDAVVAPTPVTQTVTIAGLQTGLVTLVEMPEITGGLILLAAFCAAADTLSLVFWASTGDVTPASQPLYVVQI